MWRKSNATARRSGWPGSPTSGRGQQDIEGTLGKIQPGQTVVALTHNPDIFPRIPPGVALLSAATRTAVR